MHLLQSQNVTLVENITSNSTTELEFWEHIFGKYLDITLFFMFAILGQCFNVFAFFAAKNRNGPPSGYSLINTCIASLTVVFLPIVRILREFDVINPNRYWRCGLWGIYMRFPSALTPCTMVGIFYELKMPKELFEKHLPLKVFVSAWVVAFLVSSPLFWAYELPLDGMESCKCTQIFLLGSQSVHVVYEIMVFLCLSGFPSFYMVYELRRMGFQMDQLFLFNKITEGLKSKVRQIRLIFFYMLCFLLVWVPIQLMISIYLIAVQNDSKQKDETTRITLGQIGMVLRCCFLVHLSLQPLFYLYAYDDLSIPNFLRNVWHALTFVCRIWLQQGQGPPSSSNDSEVEMTCATNLHLETAQFS